jgi:predicted nucleic acid-binding protein
MNSTKSCGGKFAVSADDAAFVRSRLESLAQVVEPRDALGVIDDDPDDDRVLECAVEGRADMIVSGDRHLLKLAKYQGVPIVTVRQFMDSTEAPL